MLQADSDAGSVFLNALQKKADAMVILAGRKSRKSERYFRKFSEKFNGRKWQVHAVQGSNNGERVHMGEKD